ncbi:MAG TPA: DbpA RNA binding domain-containing protein, partial [Longimicrobiaceae bacterium]|nr:DbpA RNA binding domain-containing protein [Longimicrobiaceae bacterium]
FSIVEVQSNVADQVIRAVNGTTMKGRSLRVDYDRGGPARRPSPKGGPGRRTTRQPPGATGGRE